MPPTILERFLDEEATSYVRGLIRGAYAEAAASEVIELREFSFNTFDVKLNFVRGTAVIFDVLVPNAEESLPLPKLFELLFEEPRP